MSIPVSYWNSVTNIPFFDDRLSTVGNLSSSNLPHKSGNVSWLSAVFGIKIFVLLAANIPFSISFILVCYRLLCIRRTSALKNFYFLTPKMTFCSFNRSYIHGRLCIVHRRLLWRETISDSLLLVPPCYCASRRLIQSLWFVSSSCSNVVSSVTNYLPLICASSAICQDDGQSIHHGGYQCFRHILAFREIPITYIPCCSCVSIPVWAFRRQGYGF